MSRGVKEFLQFVVGFVSIAFGGLFLIWLFFVTATALPWPDTDNSGDRRAEFYKEKSEQNYRLYLEERAKR